MIYSFYYYSRKNRYFILPVGNQVTSGSKVNSDVVVVYKDTVVYILMNWAHSKLNITNNWYLKYDHDKFADIIKICSFLDKTLSLNLPKIQALTGCNTTY